MAQPIPWGVAIGPITFMVGDQIHDFPKGSGKIIPKFNGDGKISPEEHLKAFFVACSILVVQHKDIVMRLFVESLNTPAAEWFYSLLDGCINDSNALRIKFESRFKTVEDDSVLVAQLGSMKKEVHETIKVYFSGEYLPMANFSHRPCQKWQIFYTVWGWPCRQNIINFR